MPKFGVLAVYGTQSQFVHTESTHTQCRNNSKSFIDMLYVSVCRDLKMENVMLDESLRNIKLIGETPFVIYCISLQ